MQNPSSSSKSRSPLNEPDSTFIGETSELHFGFLVQEKKPVKLRIECAIDFVKANQKTSCKVFLLGDRDFSGSEGVERVRVHNWKDLTNVVITREYIESPFS
ncbi:hypothetical protein [Peribacillus simplex]|uniref:hypothetical protein n=1 Tax=Peribacillus simplex TaxID=1478 RepID=UPI003D2DE3D4